MIVEIDTRSGFCFGVQKAIEKAEEALSEDGMLYSLGSIVHNEQEVLRLEKIGLKTITNDEFFKLKNQIHSFWQPIEPKRYVIL